MYYLFTSSPKWQLAQTDDLKRAIDFVKPPSGFWMPPASWQTLSIPFHALQTHFNISSPLSCPTVVLSDWGHNTPNLLITELRNPLLTCSSSVNFHSWVISLWDISILHLLHLLVPLSLKSPHLFCCSKDTSLYSTRTWSRLFWSQTMSDHGSQKQRLSIPWSAM